MEGRSRFISGLSGFGPSIYAKMISKKRMVKKRFIRFMVEKLTEDR
jgi:hypothetical protein